MRTSTLRYKLRERAADLNLKGLGAWDKCVSPLTNYIGMQSTVHRVDNTSLLSCCALLKCAPHFLTPSASTKMQTAIIQRGLTISRERLANSRGRFGNRWKTRKNDRR